MIVRSGKNIPVYIDGNTTAENARAMLAGGADGLVVGTSSILKDGPDAFKGYYTAYMKAICE